MKLPMPVFSSCDDSVLSLWKNVYAPSRGLLHDKTLEESIWRRTQNYNNKSVSGWESVDDKRRKVLHYRHQYDLLYTEVGRPYIALVSTYVYISITLPCDELTDYISIIQKGFLEGSWSPISSHLPIQKYKHGDLNANLHHYKNASQPKFEYTDFPKHYETFTLTISSNDYPISNALSKKPWTILKSGMRIARPRSNPKYVESPNEIIKHFPAQVMLGCGPSYEAGVFPLHYLHELYSIHDSKTKKFILDAKDDKFISEIISSPETVYDKITNVFAKILLAQPTDFYYVLKYLHNKEMIVGPIITNNFDGIHLRFGLQETNIRRYEEKFIAPKIVFDKRAKSLLVIGSHADRRRVEERARRQGLKIIYIDPEEWSSDDKFIPYPLESPQDNDLIYKKCATEGFLEIYKHLNYSTNTNIIDNKYSFINNQINNTI